MAPEWDSVCCEDCGEVYDSSSHSYCPHCGGDDDDDEDDEFEDDDGMDSYNLLDWGQY